MWKFQNFHAVQILRFIHSGHFEAPKTAILTFHPPLNFKFLVTFGNFKCEIFLKSKFKAFKIVKTTVFDLLKSANIDFT